MPNVRVGFFDTWQPGYGQAQVSILLANTTTLASVFTDEACTQAAANPQTLQQMTIGEISYGRWLVPLYTNAPFELSINTVDQTGVVAPPLTTLVGQDASEATVVPTGASVAGALDDILARRVDVRDFGVFLPTGNPDASAITNNASLTAAIGAVSALGGGYVEIPAGNYAFTSLTLTGGVILRGRGLGIILAPGQSGNSPGPITTLQSVLAGNVITIAAGGAGLEDIAIDGINQATGSIGVFAAGVGYIHLERAMLRRFATGMQRLGGGGSHWYDVFISDCLTGYDAQGNSDVGNGGALLNELWEGGKVELCANVGLSLKYFDSPVSQITLRGVLITGNTQVAVSLTGTQAVKFEDCEFASNGTNLQVADGVPATSFDQYDNTLGNQVDGLEFISCSFGPSIAPSPATATNTAVAAVNSIISLAGYLGRVAFRFCNLAFQTINITAPNNNILVQDCIEQPDTGMTFGGSTPLSWTRNRSVGRGASTLTTTNATQTLAWVLPLGSAEVAYLEAKIIGTSRSSADGAIWHFTQVAARTYGSLGYQGCTVQFGNGNVLTGQTSGAVAYVVGVLAPAVTLALSGVTGTFQSGEALTSNGNGIGAGEVITVGSGSLVVETVTTPFRIDATVTGGTSGATGKITGISYSGNDGTLLLRGLVGEYINGETITDSGGGTATASGTFIEGDTNLDSGTTNLITPIKTDSAWSAFFTTFGNEIQIIVSGDTGQTIDWIVDVDTVINTLQPP